MPAYRLKVADGVQAETSIDVPNAHEAVNAAVNALSQFACKRFPPPENIAITVMDAERHHIATVSFAFTIDFGDGATV